MKKTSVFLTILLVVSLIFAVSCPSKNPTAKITAPTGEAAAITVTVGGEADTKEVVVELTDDTFNEEAFNVTSGNETVLDSWFTSSDTAKATVSAKIKTNGLEEAATTKADEAKKYVKATVVLTVTPVAATAANTPVKVAFKIPTVTGDAKKWTASGKELAAENAIAITVNPKQQPAVTATSSESSVSFAKADAGKGSASTIITLTGATFKNSVNLGSITITNDMVLDRCKYSLNPGDAHQLSISFSATAPFENTDGKAHPVSIPIPASQVEVEEGYQIPDDLAVQLQITVTEN